jgi:hypothetical protein
MKVVFQAEPPGMQSAVIRGGTYLEDGSASPFGEIGQQAITFTNGVSAPVVFSSVSNGGGEVRARDVRIEWELVSGVAH